jgi:hypothetical protein
VASDALEALAQIAALRRTRTPLPPGIADIERIALARVSEQEHEMGRVVTNERGGLMVLRNK